MDAVIKAQEFVCQTHREYLEKCGWSIEECGVEACFGYLYTQGIIDEDYEKIVELENESFSQTYQTDSCEIEEFFQEEVLPRKYDSDREAVCKMVRAGNYVYVRAEKIPAYMLEKSGQPREFMIAGRWYAYNIFSHTLSVCPPEFDISCFKAV